jgi:hypothetical protein
MPRPGVTVIITDEAAPSGPALSTGAAFMVGATESGPAGVPTLVTSFKQYKAKFGSMAGGADMYKAAYAFFQEGGLYLWVVRGVGTGATAASATITGWLDLDATSPGTWGNDVDVNIDYATGTYTVKVTVDGTLMEQSVPLAAADVPNYQSQYVTMALVASPTPPTTNSTASLSGGSDGSAMTPAQFVAQLDTIGYAYGPGQVAIPGVTDPAIYPGLCAHCITNQRPALVDLPDTTDKAALEAAVQDLAGEEGGKWVLGLGQVVLYPGETAPAVWEVPYTGVQMGIVGRVDGLNDPSQVAAGSLGYSRLAISPKRDFSDDDRQDLNAQGVTLAKMVNGQFRTYGYRTVANAVGEDNWVFWQEARVVGAIAHECNVALEEYVLKTIDGRGKIFVRVNVALTGVCQRYFIADALYGETPGEAFSVNTSYPGVNTIETAAAGEIHAEIKLKTSRIGEWVTLNIVKVPLQRPIAA